MKMINSNQLLKNLNISRSLCDSNNVTNITVSITSVGTVFKTIESAPTYFIETVFFRACYVSSNMLHSLKYLQRNFLEISSIKRTILRFQSNSSYPKLDKMTNVAVVKHFPGDPRFTISLREAFKKKKLHIFGTVPNFLRPPHPLG